MYWSSLSNSAPYFKCWHPRTILKEVDTKKAPVTGPDNILAWVLTHCASERVPIVSRLFSQSLNTGHIHSYLKTAWLTASVTPFFKRRL